MTLYISLLQVGHTQITVPVETLLSFSPPPSNVILLIFADVVRSTYLDWLFHLYAHKEGEICISHVTVLSIINRRKFN